MEVGYSEFPDGKKYVFVKTGDGKRVFLRNVIFLTPKFHPERIVVVREWGAKTNTAVWEPPKGRMEWKEFADAGCKPGDIVSEASLMKYMRSAIQRETMEESKVHSSHLKGLKYLPLQYIQEYPEVKNAWFLYQFWHANITDKSMFEAQKDMEILLNDPELQQTLPHDFLEKDAVQWWDPSLQMKNIRGGFSKKLTQMYYKYIAHGP